MEGKIVSALRLWLMVTLLAFCRTILADSGNSSLKKIWENDKEVDSIRFKALADYYIRNNQANPDSALAVLVYYEKLAREKNNVKEMYNVFNDRGGIYRLKEKADSAMLFYKEAEKLANQLRDSALIATVLGNLGNVYVLKNEYLSALQHFHNSYLIFKGMDDKKGESHMLTSMGTIFLNIRDYEVASAYYQEALRIIKKVTVPERRKAVIYLNLGWMKYEQKKYDEAIPEFERALTILKKTNDKFFLVFCYSTLAKIYLEKQDREKATFFANANNKICDDLQVTAFLVENNTIFARLALLEGKVEEARKKGESILANLDKKSNNELKLNLYNLLYKCYQAEGNHEKSLKMFQLYTNCKDSIEAVVNELAVVREGLNIQFNNILQEKKLAYENEKAVQETTTRRVILLVFGLAALTIFVLTFVYLKNLREGRAKREQLLEELARLKTPESPTLILPSGEFELVREKIETAIARKLNDTDWKVLNILLKEPDISNKEIAEKAFLSVDGIGSSLRRMYQYFDIKESKYKKIALITEAIRASGNLSPER